MELFSFRPHSHRAHGSPLSCCQKLPHAPRFFPKPCAQPGAVGAMKKTPTLTKRKTRASMGGKVDRELLQVWEQPKIPPSSTPWSKIPPRSLRLIPSPDDLVRYRSEDGAITAQYRLGRPLYEIKFASVCLHFSFISLFFTGRRDPCQC